MARAACPNDPAHDRFVTVAHVAEDWVVDRDGEFVSKQDGAVEVVAPPQAGNVWSCLTCGAEAEVG